MKKIGLIVSACALLAGTNSARALQFNFIYADGMDPNAVAGFQQAGNVWSSLFTDNITLNVQVGYQPLATGVLAQAGANFFATSLDNFRNAAAFDASSLADLLAVANLPGSSTVAALMNRTSDSPHGSGSSALYLDNDGGQNNRVFAATSANMRALGLMAGDHPMLDAQITFSSSFSFDFNAGDGISAGTYDFVGIAIHELGHAMGFTSGVDWRDYDTFAEGPSSEDALPNHWMDLFRFSNNSAFGAQRDWSIDGRDKYFSIDGGETALATFSLGYIHGDGRQASHWEDSLGIGIMDPTVGAGEFMPLTSMDLLMFDVLGYDLATSEPVPEAGTMLGGAALAGLAIWRARRRR